VDEDLQDYQSRGIILKLGCGACPEQYEAFDTSGEHVGYLRLRHGHFTVECPDVGCEEVLNGRPRGDGVFEIDEREYWLEAAIAAILVWKRRRGQ
jgi:hypothetical protein